MKEKKKIFIIVPIVIFVLICVIGFSLYKTNDKVISDDLEISNANSYVKEFDNENFQGRVLESDTKEYLTLFLETKLFEGQKEVSISYDSSYYILNKANPLVSNVNILSGDKTTKSFEILVEPINNYSINFIKKDLKHEPSSGDFDVSSIN